MSEGLKDNPTQKLICVDLNGRETGKVVDRKTAHTAPGVKHLAIQILVFNSKKEFILHERPMTKVGGGVLDAPTTHVLVGETPAQAAARCLKSEYGIPDGQEIRIVAGYSYERDYFDGTCENEFCLAAYTLYDGKIVPNKAQVVTIVRIPTWEVVEDLILRPENYPPWFKDTVRVVKDDIDGGTFFL
jgi:isopentenyl-diphosphate delta-isomerase